MRQQMPQPPCEDVGATAWAIFACKHVSSRGAPAGDSQPPAWPQLGFDHRALRVQQNGSDGMVEQFRARRVTVERSRSGEQAR